MNNTPTNNEEVIIKIAIKSGKMHLLTDLTEECNLPHHGALFDEFVTLFQSAVEGIKAGKQPALYDPNSDDVEITLTPGLSAVANKYPLPTQSQKPQLTIVKNDDNSN